MLWFIDSPVERHYRGLRSLLVLSGGATLARPLPDQRVSGPVLVA